MSDDGEGGPYREPGDTRLGRVVRRFDVRRRPRYLGSARAVATPAVMSIGGFLPSATRMAPVGLGRRGWSEGVEVCERGVRIVARSGILELLWDQITDLRRADDPAGVAAIVITGVHGEQVTLDRTLRDLGELAALLAAQVKLTPPSP